MRRTATATTAPTADDTRFGNGGGGGGDLKSSSSSSSWATSTGDKLSKWSKSKLDLLVPSLRSLVTTTTNKLSAGKATNNNANYQRRNSCTAAAAATTLRRNVSLNNVTSGVDAGVGGRSKNAASSGNIAEMCLLNGAANANGGSVKRLGECDAVLARSGCVNRNAAAFVGAVRGVEPLHPLNRLRSQDAISTSRICSRCSSLLSMASSSRYSLNSAYGFVPVPASRSVSACATAPTVLCKVCLNEVALKDSWTLQHCECSYCIDCVRSYVEFEINQGAYSISCPDAQCEKQGIILLEEIESLVSLENTEKHKRYRLNQEVEMDKSRTWCPRAGCETVCTLCLADRCTPQSVHCPTCNMDFCSNCRATWHSDSPCKSEEAVPGVTFDSELIKCCPMCSVPIEKDEGCAQMLCKRCKHVFCWYCLASLDDDFLLRHYDKGPCKNKLGHSRASVIWHRTQVISIFAGFGILLLIASPLLLLAAPCIVCCRCRMCSSDTKLDVDDDLTEAAELQPSVDPSVEKDTEENSDTPRS